MHKLFSVLKQSAMHEESITLDAISLLCPQRALWVNWLYSITKARRRNYMPVSIHREEFWRKIMIQVTDSLWEGIWDKLIF